MFSDVGWPGALLVAYILCIGVTLSLPPYLPETEHLVKSYATNARRSSLKENVASELRMVGPKRLSPLVAPVSPWGRAEMMMSCEGEKKTHGKMKKKEMKVVQLSGDLLEVGDRIARVGMQAH